MKKTMALFGLVAALFLSGTASAAQVDLFLTQQGTTGAPSNDWLLTMNTEAAVGGIAFQISYSGTGSFVLGPNAAIDNCTTGTPSGFSLCQNAGNVVRISAAPTGAAMAPAGVTGFFVGTFTGTGTIQLLPANPGDGDTAVGDDFETALTFSLTTTPVPPPVPEPSAILLLGIALGGLSLARRSA
jgi:hypothetical protein